MRISDSLAMFAFCLIYFLIGLFAGINSGIQWSSILGPRTACETYKLSILECSKMRNLEEGQ